MQPTSAQHMWNLLPRLLGKAFQGKLVERMPRVCNAVIKSWVATLKNLKYKIYFDLLLFSLLFYNVENSTNKEKPLNE